jgi:hypothetical protein
VISRVPFFNLPKLSSRFGKKIRVAVGLSLAFGSFVGTLSFGRSAEAESSRNVLTSAQEHFLAELQQRSFLYFQEHSDPVSGLALDRAPADGRPSKSPASIAATGFALSAWCIADRRGWLPRGEALQRVLKTLNFVATEAPQKRGWLYHFIDARDGHRVWNCEVSTIDTALFLQGALETREYFDDPKVTQLVNELYGRIDWRWALNGGMTLSHGWRPEAGFIPNRWDSYAEMLGLYLLGIGAPGPEALPAATWQSWNGDRW